MHFFAYSSSIVLWGRYWDDPQSPPTNIVIPELQNRSVISVVAGRDHFVALTSSGKLLTWGKYSEGALGLEDPSSVESLGGHTEGEQAYTPPEVTVPTEVRFDHDGEGRVERYCFAMAARENHTAALVVDLSGDEVPPEHFNQNAICSVSSSLVCNNLQLRVSRLIDSTAQSARNPHTGGPAGGDANFSTRIHFI